MAGKVSAIICTCELENGYIFKNFFAFNSLRGRPTITFMADKIFAGNRTADDQIYGSGTLHGDELNLTWDESIPEPQRNLNLTFDATRLQIALSRIRKKDPSRITVTQLRDMHDPYNFCGKNSSDEFTIYVSCGEGGDGREGLKSVPAIRSIPDNTLIKNPQRNKSYNLVIPIKKFRSMIDSFAKCKKETIHMCFYTNKENNKRPGFTISTEGTINSGRIFEKFGDVPDDDSSQSIKPPSFQLNNLRIDESNIVRTQNLGIQPLFEIVKVPEANEYIFNADKIGIFCRIASMHNEGNVRIQYQPGCHLRIAHRFGAFGEADLSLNNPHVTFDSTEGKN